MGAACKGRKLQGCSCSLNGGRVAALNGGREETQGQSYVMMIERDRGQDTPRQCLGSKARCSDWDLAGGLLQGQRSNAPRKQAGHMTAPQCDQRHVSKPLRKRSRPHMTSPELERPNVGVAIFLDLLADPVGVAIAVIASAR